MTDTRRKKQPTAEQLRDELRRAAGTIEALKAKVARLEVENERLAAEMGWETQRADEWEQCAAELLLNPWQRLLRWWRS